MKAIALTVMIGLGLTAQKTIAQMIPDNTVGTIVSPTNLITGGTRSGSNLFHSFSQFSIPTNGSAIFNNAIDIQNIFSRVTGNTQSSIDGLIKAQGNANLFLMNPNGILFGPNAKLELGGSFVGTTANSIKFADGVQFGPNDLTSNPLLTVSLPIGLQMGTNPGAITVQGNGHQLSTANSTAPATFSATPTGLQVEPGQTLALMGGNLNFSGGTLTANQGQVAIAAIASGQVDLTPSKQGWDFDYSGVPGFQDIRLAQQSMLNASGIGGGRIQIQGANISLTDGSTALIQNFGLVPGGGIQVRATDSLTIQGSTPNEKIASGSRINQLGELGGGTIQIDTRRLSLQQGGEIRAQNFGKGASSDVLINATESMLIDGFTPITRRISDSTTRSFGAGASGAVTITAGEISLLNGGGFAALAFGPGRAGDVTATVDRTLLVRGTEPTLVQRSGIASASIVIGNAGQVRLKAQHINVEAGGGISSSASAQGNGGNLIVNASESITVQGKGNGLFDYSSIDASVIIFDQAFQRLYNLPPVPSGSSGNLTLTTSRLNILDGGIVSVRNEGTGNAGNLVVNANTIRLDRQGRITAATQAGEGGNLNVKADSLILRHTSSITATANGNGNGGNIIINSPAIVGLENSDIIANATKGRGGNITIQTQGILGLKYRPYLTFENDITASSQFGINGTVQVNSLGLDPSSGLTKLPGEVTDSSRSIAKGCAGNQGNRFIATGRGGIPQGPNKKRGSDRSWQDLRALLNSNPTAQIQDQKLKLIEATRIQTNPDGSIALMDGSAIGSVNAASCSGVDVTQ